MSSDGIRVTSAARQTLDAWRERGAHRLDPLRFSFIEALERRAAGHSGEARRLLDDRLMQLMEAYADDLQRAEARPADVAREQTQGISPTRGALGELVDYIGGDAPKAASWPELGALEYFREIWSRVSTERQLRQSLEQVPGNAGPLNSSSLVHRSLSLMRELSPGYLQQFLSYVDTLSWMEQMNGGGGAAADREAPRAASTRKGARSKAR